MAARRGSTGLDRPAAPSRPGRLLMAPVAFVGCQVLVAAAAIQNFGRITSDRDADLAAQAFVLTRLGLTAAPTGNHGDDLLIYHLAAYGAGTAGYSRLDSVAAVAHEGLLVAALLSAGLLWIVARRIGLGVLSTVVAVAVLGLAPALLGLAQALLPATFAVLWLLVAAVWTVEVRVRAAHLTLGILATGVAALLAPVVLILVGATVAAAAWNADFGRRWSGPWRQAGAAVLSLGTIAAVIWVAVQADPIDTVTADPIRAGLDGRTATLSCLALLLVAAVALWRLPGLRAAAVGLAVLMSVAVSTAPVQLSAIVIGTPVAALLLGAMVESALRQGAMVPSAGRRRLVTGLASVTVLAAVVTAGAAVAQPEPTGPATADPAAGLATWVDTQIDPAATVLVDRRTWADLVQAGLPASRISMVEDFALPAATSTAFRVDADVAAGNGAVLASFGTDSRVLQVAYCSGSATANPDPGAACRPGTGPEQTADRWSRAQLGSALLSNPSVQFSPAAREVVADGLVDSRLLVVLAALSAEHSVTVSAFPAVAGEPAEAVRRSAHLGAIDGQPAVGDSPSAGAASGWLAGQQAPYRPDVVEYTRDSLVIRYYAPSPLGLLDG